MAVTKEDVKYIAGLARLTVTEEQTEEYASQINDILKYIDKLNELDTEGIEPLSYPVEILNVFREDDVIAPVSREEALKNAPESTEEFFKVPKVINVE